MESTPQENQRPALQPSTASVEVVARLAASALLIVYGIGFVIVGFHDARYGVVQFSPFRTKIVLVGFVFAALVVLATAAQHYGFAYVAPLESVRNDSDPSRRWDREIVLANGFIFTAFLMASLLSLFLFAPTQMRESIWRRLAGFASYLVAGGIFFFVNKMFIKKPRQSVYLSALAFLVFVIPLVSLPSSASASLAAIFAWVGLEAAAIKRSGNRLKHILNFRNLVPWFLILWLYISQIFGQLPPRWGGGQPTPVMIYLNSPAPWSPSNPLEALLLDETEQGVYVLLSPTGRAFYIPRNDIVSVFFGTKEQLIKK